MLTDYFLLIITVAYCRANSTEEFATVRARLTQEGFIFFSKFGHYIVNEEIGKVTFPEISIPIKDGPGTGNVNVTQLTLLSFESPNITINLRAPTGIIWQTTNGFIKLNGYWLAVYDYVEIIHLSGYVEAKISDIRAYLQTNFEVKNNRPQLEITHCFTEVLDLEVYVTGGVIQWIINLFRSQLAAAVRQVIHKKMCGVLRRAVADLDISLSKLATHFKVYKNLYIHYSFQQRPKVMNNYIESEIVADLTYGKDKCALASEAMDSEVDSMNRMAHIWISEHVPNCLLHTLYNNENLTFAITSSTSHGQFANFLKTNCGLTAICIGQFFPTLRHKYPNESVDVLIGVKEVPLVVITVNGIALYIECHVDLYLTSDVQKSKRLAELIMNTTVSVIPSIFKKRLVGSVGEIILSLREHDSIIGHFDVKVLQFMQKLLAKAVRVVLGAALKVGLPLPIIDNVSITDESRIVTKNNYIRIDFDLIYG
ncbi:unnamed protein product [Thelazia callipaeda]|uniref:BPI1 domain-containing protein n=1 Tax=Thelazia callipaeda TaxID=103827 RepID=A0A0N5D6W2_THECL|nr:unnamed protein product [Thelazia callipaeda]